MAARQRSAAAAHLDALGAELRLSQARSQVFPHVVALRRRNAHSKRNKKADKDEGSISKKELQQLACFWRLNRIPGFWAKNATFDALLTTLSRHVQQAVEAVSAPRVALPRTTSLCDGGTLPGRPYARGTPSAPHRRRKKMA